MLALFSSSGDMRWLIVLMLAVSASYAQDDSSPGQEITEDDGADGNLDVQLNNALNITDRQNFVFNSSFVLSSSSCITPDGEKGSCKAVSRCPKYLERASQLGTDENVEFFRERICRLLHRTVHVCCPSEEENSPADENESTQSQPQPQPDSQLGTRQRPQSQTQPQQQTTPQTQTEQPLRTRPGSQSQPEEQPEAEELPQTQPRPQTQPQPQPGTQTESEPETQTTPASQQQPEQKPTQPQTDRQPRPQVSTESAPQSQTTSMIPTEEQCGLPVGSSRLPGVELKPGNWPWLAVIGGKRGSNNFVPTCTGALITRRHVLTAAHCLEGSMLDAVKLGEHHLDNDDAGEKPEVYSISNRRTHDFNSTTSENDIAILTLDRDVVFNDFIQPVCLPFNFTNEEFVGDSPTLVAWQTAESDSPSTSKIPLEVRAPVVARRECAEDYQNLTESVPVDSRHLCASTELLDSCIGESGGPLNYLNRENGRYYLIGVASLEYQCPTSNLPGVFTRVSSFLDWIQDTLQDTLRP